jgi:hypothetical protein
MVIPLDTFKQYLLETFFQPKVKEMEINKTPIQKKFKIFAWLVGLSPKKNN